MQATTVSASRGDGWAVVRLITPGGLNKLGSSTLESLRDVLGSLLADPGVRCVAILGEGGSFAVGADLREILRLDPRSAREFSLLGYSVFRIMEQSGTVVVAAIDGFCLGGGLDLALAADWRLGTDRSTFGHPGSDLGLITGFGGTQRLPRLIGGRAALAWALESRRVKADEALRSGLLQEVCAPEEFGTRLEERIQHFLSLPAGRIEGANAAMNGFFTTL
ncbi:MAG TPA: enoyl-CoA hydratase/isomerase family protein [Proteobacteria bacterium]|nr:enoyl-CoA hydratase/isomerase family protein [Pseudomonadota bacterium]